MVGMERVSVAEGPDQVAVLGVCVGGGLVGAQLLCLLCYHSASQLPAQVMVVAHASGVAVLIPLRGDDGTARAGGQIHLGGSRKAPTSTVGHLLAQHLLAGLLGGLPTL